MKKLCIYLLTFLSVSLLFFACEEDETIIIDEVTENVTIAQFLASNPLFETFFNAAEASAIPFELAQQFGFSPLEQDPVNGLAVRSFGQDGAENTFYSVLDLLNVEEAEFTVFVPRLNLSGSFGTSLDLTDINLSQGTNEEIAQLRGEIGNILLYHMLDRRVRISDLIIDTSIVPLSSGGNDEIFITSDEESGTGVERLLIGGSIFSEFTDIETNLSNGILHNINDIPLSVTAATPVPIVRNSNAFTLSENGEIEVFYTRALSPESVANTPLDAFTLTLDGIDVNISSISLSSESDLVVVLTPSVLINNNFNNLELSYTGDTIESVLSATSDLEGFAEQFSDIPVLASVNRIFDLSTDFESTDAVGSNNRFVYRSREPQATRSSEQAFNGLFSFRFANFPDGTDLSEASSEVVGVNYLPGRVRTLRDFPPRAPLTNTSATYRLEFALYIEDLPVVDAAAPVEFEFRVQGQPGGILAMPRFDVVSNPPTLTFNPDPADPLVEVTTPLIKGSWQIVKVDIPGSSFVLANPNNLYRYVFTTAERNNPNPFLFYLDDIRIYQLD